MGARYDKLDRDLSRLENLIRSYEKTKSWVKDTLPGSAFECEEVLHTLTVAQDRVRSRLGRLREKHGVGGE